MTVRIEKVWGTTEALLRTPMFELHRLRIKPWHRCSYHVHQFKHNAFYVIEGALFIDEGTGLIFGEPQRNFRVRDKEFYTVPPGVKHQFRTAEESCVALEMYFTEPLSEDIKRFDVGSALC